MLSIISADKENEFKNVDIYYLKDLIWKDGGFKFIYHFKNTWSIFENELAFLTELEFLNKNRLKNARHIYILETFDYHY